MQPSIATRFLPSVETLRVFVANCARPPSSIILLPHVTSPLLISLLPILVLQLLVKWWAEYPGELLEARVVKPLQKYLTDELYATKKLTIRWVAKLSNISSRL